MTGKRSCNFLSMANLFPASEWLSCPGKLPASFSPQSCAEVKKVSCNSRFPGFLFWFCCFLAGQVSWPHFLCFFFYKMMSFEKLSCEILSSSNILWGILNIEMDVFFSVFQATDLSQRKWLCQHPLLYSKSEQMKLIRLSLHIQM